MDFTPIANISILSTGDEVVTLRHDFDIKDEQVVGIKSGLPVSPEELKSLLLNVIGVGADVDFVPNNVFRQKQDSLGWVCKSHKRKLYFNMAGKKTEIEVTLPNLVFLVSENGVKVGAISSAEYGADTEVFHAPLFNFYDSCLMCVGSVGLPAVFGVLSISDWEEAVLGSYGSHSNHRELLRKPDGYGYMSDIEIISYLRKLKGSEIDFQLLTSTNQTLSEWVKG